jgi:hypothetical protein
MQIVGRIIAVQEERFRLSSDGGQVYLLTLAARSGLNSPALSKLHKEQSRVSVHFSGEPNLTGGVAENVRRIGG